MSGSIPNQAISASAGSGKTYQLTHRFIRLLHHCECPERIVALTFTRSAAGEFFARIVDKLAKGAEGPQAAAALSDELGIEADPVRYRELLRLLLGRMHRLNLQTLDSFFHRIASAFALELGLAGNLRLLDEHAAPRARRAVCDRMIHHQRKSDSAVADLWQAFNQATYGTDERGIERTLTRFVDELHQLFLEAPEAARWGDPQTIWGATCPWDASEVDVEAEGRNLLEHLPDDLGPSQRTAMEKLVAEAAAHPVAQKRPSALLGRVLERCDRLRGGSIDLTAGGGKKKHFTLAGPACDALEKLVRSVVWFELKRALETTCGAHRILQAFDTLYDRRVRRPGRLAFADVLHLLATGRASPLLPTTDPQTRLLLDYRLDARFDHWLLDEFQDTSRLQWSVIENLADEVLQDASGARTFFYVGDTKQCLYLWRNSDDRLFHEIADRYAGNLELAPLYRSWRSAPPVLDAVNTVFGDTAAIAGHFGEGVARRWARAWHPHQPSPATASLPGQVCWIKAETGEEEENADRGESELVLRLLRDLRPLERGISVGVLARSNRKVRETADYLRAHGGPPVHTGSAIQPAVDNAAGAALLSLLKLAAHPGDGFARRHLEMTGLFPDRNGPGTAAARLRRQIFQDGPRAGLASAARAIAAALAADDDYHRSRLDLLVEAAGAFEEEDDEPSFDHLHDFLKGFTSSEVRSGEAVVIETIHKAKGLEYDCVILLESGRKSTLGMDGRIRPRRHRDGIDWILKPFARDFMLADPVLAQVREEAAEEGGFAALCTLYVAMTRARRGLYVISPEGRLENGSVVKFLRDVLGGGEMEPADLDLFGGGPYPVLWSTGEADWLAGDGAPPPPDSRPGPLPTATGAAPEAPPRLKLRLPSATGSFVRSGDQFFQSGPRASSRGSAVHAAFEAIEWIDPGKPAPVPADAPAEVRTILETCFADPAVRELFTHPTGPCELWREKSFSRVDGEVLVRGVFDRVILRRGADGTPVSAEIIDFKTDRLDANNTLDRAAAHHRSQMEAYRSALSALTGLPESAIGVTLLFTSMPALRRFPD